MSIKLANAPDSWGVWFPSHESQPSWQQCLDEIRASGFDGVELGPWGYFPQDPAVLKEEIDSRSLTLIAGTVGCDFLSDESVDAMLETIDEVAETLSHFPEAKYLVLLPAMYTDLETGVQVMDPELTDEQWNTMVANVQRAADYTAAKGLVAAFHPHVDCHVETEAEIERLLADTTVDLCFDTGHHVYGGGEPISFYRKHADRIPYLHIKDCDLDVKAQMDKEGWSFAKAVTKGIMTEPGNGGIDLAEMRAALEEAGYDGWLTVEQDLFPVESFDVPLRLAKIARENLAKAGF